MAKSSRKPIRVISTAVSDCIKIYLPKTFFLGLTESERLDSRIKIHLPENTFGLQFLEKINPTTIRKFQKTRN